MPGNPDQKFVKEAAAGGRAEVELGKMAAHKAMDPRVKAFGQRMADDHGKAGDELNALAQSKHILVPDTIDPKDKASHHRLMRLSGAAFDRAYMDAMVKITRPMCGFSKTNRGPARILRSRSGRARPFQRFRNIYGLRVKPIEPSERRGKSSANGH